MFYVTNISGELIPFEPSRTSGVVTAVTAVEVGEEVSTIGVTERSDDSAIYEGAAVPRSDIILGNASSIGWAGAVRSYRIQASDRVADAVPSESTLGAREPVLGELEAVADIDGGFGESAQRVDPVRRDRPRYSPEVRDRRRAVVAQDLMSSPVFTLVESLPIEEAEKVFRLRKFRHIPVVSASGALVGILSDRDFFWAARHPSGAEREAGDTVRERMVTNILTARPLTEIPVVAEVMITHHIGCLPIVDERSVLVGVLTRSDILRGIVNHAPIELWT